MRDHGALVVVDAVSAAGGLPLETDAWGLDVVLSGSQKAWMCPPGLLLMAIGSRAWEAHEHASFPRYFWDFGAARRNAANGMSPTTPPLTMLYALRAALELIETEGLERVWERHRRVGEVVRASVAALGLQLFPDPAYASNTLTGVRPPNDIPARDLVAAVRKRHGIELEAGKGPVIDDILRIGHMGWVEEPELERAVAAIGETLEAWDS